MGRPSLQTRAQRGATGILVGALASLALVLAALAGPQTVVGVLADESPITPAAIAVVTEVPAITQAKGVGADQDTHRVYAALHGGNSSANLAIIDGTAGTLLSITGTLGTHPNGVAVDSSRHKVYVTNKDNSELSVLDMVTGNRQKITVGGQPWGVAANQSLNRIYVANFSSNSVSIVNGDTLAVQTISNITQPAFVAVMPSTGQVYVTSLAQGTQILAADGAKVGMFNSGSGSLGVAANPATGRIYVANRQQSKLFVGSGGSDPIQVIDLPRPPVQVAVNPSTNHIFVTLLDVSGLYLTVLDGATGGTITTLGLGAEDVNEGGQGLAVDALLHKVYIARYQAGTVVIVSDDPLSTPTATPTRTATRTMTASSTATVSPTPLPSATPTPTSTRTATALPSATATPSPTSTPTATAAPATPSASATATASSTPSATATATASPTITLTPVPQGTIGIVFTTTVAPGMKGLAVDSSRHHVYAAMLLENSVRVLDGVTGGAIKTLTTGGTQSNGVAVNEQTGMVYVSNRISGNISAINPDTGAYQTAQSGLFPWGIAVDGGRNRVYVAHFGSDIGEYTVAFFNATSLQKTGIATIGRHPALLAANPANGRAYVTTYSADAGTYVVDSSGSIVDMLNTGSGSFGVAVNPLTGRIFVTNRSQNRLYLVGPGAARTLVDLGAPGYGVAVNPATNHVFVVVISDGQASVQVHDGDSGALLTTLPLGPEDTDNGGQGIAVDPTLSRVYVASYSSGVLTIIADASGAQPPTATPTRTSTVSPTPTTKVSPTVTTTPSATPTTVATPGGGWTARVYLPIIMHQGLPTATPTATWMPTPTATQTRQPTPTHSVDWQIPDFLHVSLVPAEVSSGQVYWQLVRAVYQDETQSGGNHNIYYRLEDEGGQSLLGLSVCLGFPWSPYQDCSHYTEQRGGTYPPGYTADYPIWGTGWNPSTGPGPYSAWAGGLPSDRVVGMGMPLNFHVNFLLTWRRSVAP